MGLISADSGQLELSGHSPKREKPARCRRSGRQDLLVLHKSERDDLQARQVRAADLIWLKVRPAFDDLRAEPRFIQLCKEIGLSH